MASFGRTRLLIAVLAMLGMLSSCSAYDHIQRERQKQTLNRLRALSYVLAEMKAHTGEYPVTRKAPVQQFMETLRPYSLGLPILRGESHAHFAHEDGRGEPIWIMSSRDSFVVWSNGADRAPDPRRPGGRLKGFHRDLIWTDREAWQWYEGLAGESRPKHPEDPFKRVERDWAAR